eukprot:TRINITY_DN7322_c0_g1_i3.p1 TRINITY_DN7322_c0_g1~~TRINITY_DN7322_c0_g1_i3.p1  ORF type:complete len:232 (-),score=26.57 TRINITY_DN7322_c0_g1_i3:191-886(-)
MCIRDRVSTQSTGLCPTSARMNTFQTPGQTLHEDLDVLILGDRAYELACLLTSIEHRTRTFTSCLGVNRMTQLFVTENYWIGVNFHCLDDFLLDPHLVHSTMAPFKCVLITYIAHDEESLNTAEKLVQRFLPRAEPQKIKNQKKNQTHSRKPKNKNKADFKPKQDNNNLTKSTENVHPSYSIPFGLLISVDVNTQSDLYTPDDRSQGYKWKEKIQARPKTSSDGYSLHFAS